MPAETIHEGNGWTLDLDPRQPGAGVRIIAEHPGSDSLVILELTHRYGNVAVRVLTRGNFDVHRRPARTTYVSLPAPPVTAATREARRVLVTNTNWRDLPRHERERRLP
jgi:hypothetical protein